MSEVADFLRETKDSDAGNADESCFVPSTILTACKIAAKAETACNFGNIPRASCWPDNQKVPQTLTWPADDPTFRLTKPQEIRCVRSFESNTAWKQQVRRQTRPKDWASSPLSALHLAESNQFGLYDDAKFAELVNLCCDFDVSWQSRFDLDKLRQVLPKDFLFENSAARGILAPVVVYPEYGPFFLLFRGIRALWGSHIQDCLQVGFKLMEDLHECKYCEHFPLELLKWPRPFDVYAKYKVCFSRLACSLKSSFIDRKKRCDGKS